MIAEINKEVYNTLCSIVPSGQYVWFEDELTKSSKLTSINLLIHGSPNGTIRVNSQDMTLKELLHGLLQYEVFQKAVKDGLTTIYVFCCYGFYQEEYTESGLSIIPSNNKGILTSRVFEYQEKYYCKLSA